MSYFGNLSQKQYKYSINLLSRIGFTDSKLRYEYLRNINSLNSNFYEHLGYSKPECIDELLKEVEIKKNLHELKIKKPDNDYITATDIASFNFCPASYAISRSFEIESDKNEIRKFLGAEFHETLRLIDKSIPDGYSDEQLYDPDILENEKVTKIKNCELIFSGHTTDMVLFKNEEENFVGQPDYIFKDPNGDFFVVEEKFKFLNVRHKEIENHAIGMKDFYRKNPDLWEENETIKRNKNSFFSNHILQVESYIQYIKEYPIKYGVLIYWYYDFHGGKNNVPGFGNVAKVHSVTVKVIKRNDHLSLLRETKNSITKLVSNEELEFDQKVNPIKCAACSVNKYCGHKTNNFKDLTMPYSKKYLELKKVGFYD